MTDGKLTSQFKTSKEKAKLFAGGILQSRMHHYNATTAYNLYYLAIIGYMLAATQFSINQCKTIKSPVSCATLKKMSINRNVSRRVVFGPKHMGGMALMHLHVLQCIHRTKYLIGHITNNDGVGKLMRICIEAIQLEVVTFEPFFFLPNSLHGYTLVLISWINEIWFFNELFTGTIKISNTWLPHPQRESDQAVLTLAV
jgi:hypothetical protein